MNRIVLIFSATALLFGSFITASADDCQRPPIMPPPGSVGHGSTGFRTFYPPGAMPCPSVPPYEIAPGYGAIAFPGWYYHHYAPYYYPQQEQKPDYYKGVRTAGEIRVLVRPPNAKVFVDGVELTDADSENAYATGVLTGTHSVEVQAEGYRPHSENVTVETARTTSLTVELMPKSIK